MQKQAEKILKKYLKPNSVVIFGLSGGPDSVYLLYLLLRIKNKLPFKLIVAHVNHKLRGRQSDLDEKFAKKLAKKHKLTFELATLPAFHKGNLEEQGRDFRYSFFERLRQKYRANLIITAHHLNDSIETALFNLARGSYLKGLIGMQEFQPKRHLLRPLLHLTKDEILSYLKKKKIAYRKDQSNLNLAFSRNRIRNKIIPQFKKINSNFENNFLAFMESLAETDKLIHDFTDQWMKTAVTDNGLALDQFLRLRPILQKNVIASLYRQHNGNTRKFNRQHLDQIILTLKKNRAGLKKEFGDKFFITVTKNATGAKIIRCVAKPKTKSAK